MNIFSLFENEKKMFYLVIGILVGVSFVFYYVVYLPQRVEIYEKQSLYLVKKAELKQLEKYMAQHPDMAEYEKNLLKRLDDSQMRLPETMDLSGFINEVQIIAIQSGITVKGIVPQDVVKLDKYLFQDIQIELSGDYQQALEFLSALEQNKRFITFEKMKICSKNDYSLEISLRPRIYAKVIN